MTNLILKKDNTIQRTENVIQAEIDGELVMMNLISGDYFGLDVIASRIWELLESPKKINTITEQLLLEFEVEPEQCQEDVYSLLTRFHQYKIIEVIT